MLVRTYDQLVDLIEEVSLQIEQVHENRTNCSSENDMQYAENTGIKDTLLSVLLELSGLEATFLEEYEELMNKDPEEIKQIKIEKREHEKHDHVENDKPEES